ncbi:hypothetical protein ACKGJO_00415 [Gracilimonas sp. Q87]|uniref:hypothetical protein n=1 Tax=Gracilimonas sp. Q87 TaxID=3384766 RepID=UPI00398425D3
MKKLIFTFMIVGLLGSLTSVNAQINDGHQFLKKHINSVVEEVEEVKSPDKKREILDESLGNIIKAIERVSEKKSVSVSEKENLAEFKDQLIERRDELNGENGYGTIPNSQLNNFANFIQQDIEQADRLVTLSLTTVLLIVLILLLI